MQSKNKMLSKLKVISEPTSSNIEEKKVKKSTGFIIKDVRFAFFFTIEKKQIIEKKQTNFEQDNNPKSKSKIKSVALQKTFRFKKLKEIHQG